MSTQQTITAQRTWVGVAIGIAALLLYAGIAVVFGWERLVSYPGVLLLAFAIASLGVAVGQRRSRLELDDEGMNVAGQLWGRDRHYAWKDLLEVGWHNQPQTLLQRMALIFVPGRNVGCTVFVRPKGGRFDVPGPNAPAQVAILAIFGKREADAARALLKAECERHGVPFSDRGLRMLEDPPPGSPLRASDKG